MKRLLSALVLLLALVSPAAAINLYVSPSGSDSNNCRSATMPCATMQHAVDLVPQGGIANIFLAPGTYYQGVNAHYYRFLNFYGNNGIGCDPTKTVVQVGNGTTAFWAQDHVIMGVNCVTIQSNGISSIGVGARQFSIVDLFYTWFGNFVSGIHISANEMSKINTIEGIQALGSASSHVSATGMSTVHLGGTIYVAPGLAFNNFTQAYLKSLLDGSAVSMNVPYPPYGYSQCNDASSTLYPPAGGFPGNLGPC